MLHPGLKPTDGSPGAATGRGPYPSVFQSEKSGSYRFRQELRSALYQKVRPNLELFFKFIRDAADEIYLI